MTSGRWWYALWAALIPFAIANTALWMLPRPRSEPSKKTPSRWWLVARACIRVIALLLTALFMMQTSLVAVDVVANQCLGGSAAEMAMKRSPGDGPLTLCLQGIPPADFVRGKWEWLAFLVGFVLLLILIVGAGITRFTRRDTGEANTPEENEDEAFGQRSAPPPVGEPGLQADDLYDGMRDAKVLRVLHGVAAAGGATLVVSGGSVPVNGGLSSLAWWFAAISIVLSVCIALLVDCNLGGRSANTDGRSEPRIAWLSWFAGPSGVAVVAVSWVVMAVSCIGLPELAARHTAGERFKGIEAPIGVAIVSAVLALLILSVALIKPLWQASEKTWKHFPAVYRPWLRGWMPVLFCWTAIVLGPAFGVGLARVVANVVTGRIPLEFLGVERSSSEFEVSELYQTIALQWGIVFSILAPILIVSALVVFVLARFIGQPIPEAMAGTCPADAAGGKSKAVWRDIRLGFGQTGGYRRRWFVARINQHLHQGLLLLAVVLLLASIAAVVSWCVSGVDDSQGMMGHELHVLRGLGVVGLTFVVVSLSRLIYSAVRNPTGVGRSLGVLWDLSSFWPREAHPVVPHCYAPVAVNDIVKRVEKHLTERPKRVVVLSGHSQGSLLMYAAVLRLMKKGADVDRIGLLTYGSQLQWAYGRAFPAYLGFDSHCTVMAGLRGRWINLIRFTDPVGGPVLSWDLKVNPENTSEGMAHWLVPSDGAEGSVGVDGKRDYPGSKERRSFPLVPGLWKLGHEYRLPDPPLERYDPRYPLGHSNYPRDVDWPRFVADVLPVDIGSS